MDWQACFTAITNDVATETESLRNLGDSIVEENRRGARLNLSDWLCELAKIDDIRDIENLVKVEGIFLEGEAAVCQDRPERLASINAGMEQMAAVSYHVQLLRSPRRYKEEVDPLFSISRDRVGGVPKDMARRALGSHVARYSNDLKACRGPDDERRYYASHLDFIRNLQRLYIVAQRQALGIKPETRR